MTFEELNEATDGLGASLGVDAGRLFVDLSLRCLRDDLPAMLDLAADVLRRPTFPEAEVEKVRNELLTSIREGDNDTRSTADRAMRRLLFPPPHPYGRRVGGELDSVSAITRDDLVAFHAARFGPAVLTVAVVGGVDSFARAREMVAERFGDWQAAASAPPRPDHPALPDGPLRAAREIPAKTQVDLRDRLADAARGDAAYYAFDTANLILGGSG
jgi:zinc protease